jgi:hypothetical protein
VPLHPEPPAGASTMRDCAPPSGALVVLGLVVPSVGPGRSLGEGRAILTPYQKRLPGTARDLNERDSGPFEERC